VQCGKVKWVGWFGDVVGHKKITKKHEKEATRLDIFCDVLCLFAAKFRLG
jgi:hypothetical protein